MISTTQPAAAGMSTSCKLGARTGSRPEPAASDSSKHCDYQGKVGATGSSRLRVCRQRVFASWMRLGLAARPDLLRLKVCAPLAGDAHLLWAESTRGRAPAQMPAVRPRRAPRADLRDARFRTGKRVPRQRGVGVRWQGGSRLNTPNVVSAEPGPAQSGAIGGRVTTPAANAATASRFEARPSGV
jgi:hypothetical protein